MRNPQEVWKERDLCEIFLNPNALAEWSSGNREDSGSG